MTEMQDLDEAGRHIRRATLTSTGIAAGAAARASRQRQTARQTDLPIPPPPAWDSPEARAGRGRQLTTAGVDPELVEGMMLADLSRAAAPAELVTAAARKPPQQPAAQAGKGTVASLDIDGPGK